MTESFTTEFRYGQEEAQAEAGPRRTGSFIFPRGTISTHRTLILMCRWTSSICRPPMQTRRICGNICRIICLRISALLPAGFFTHGYTRMGSSSDFTCILSILMMIILTDMTSMKWALSMRELLEIFLIAVISRLKIYRPTTRSTSRSTTSRRWCAFPTSWSRIRPQRRRCSRR